MNSRHHTRPTPVRPLETWLVELAPLACVSASLLIKMVYFNVSLSGVWVAPEEPLGQLVRSHPEGYSATLASLLLLCAALPLLSRAWRFVVLIGLDVAVTSVVVADLVHVQYYGDVISLASLPAVHMLPSVASSVVKLLRPVHVLQYLDVVAGLAILPFYRRACDRIPSLEPRAVRRFALTLLIAGLVLALPTIRVLWQDPNGLGSYTSLQREVCVVMGLIPYHVGDAVVRLVSGAGHFGEQERGRVRRFFGSARRPRPESSMLFGVARRRNLIVLMAESLQSFPVGLEIGGQPITPRLSAFARQALYFTNFYDQTYLGTTADGEFTSLQSLHPLPVGVVASTYPGNRYYGLPTVLGKHGYRTLSAVAAPGSFWNMSRMHPRLGFERSFFAESFAGRERIGRWLPDQEFFDQAIGILKSETEPFMAFLLSSSNHHPWELPPKHRVLNLGPLEGTMLGKYLHSVHYFDGAFGRLVDGLSEAGLLERSVVVLYGDHQAFLGKQPELARLLRFPDESEYHHLVLSKRLPFIIRLPYGAGAATSRVTGGHLDVAPTLLSVLGIANHDGLMLGQDLTRGEDAFVVFRDGSFVDGRFWFVNRLGPATRARCYEMDVGRPVDCTALEEPRRKARERLEISDLIIRGNGLATLGDWNGGPEG